MSVVADTLSASVDGASATVRAYLDALAAADYGRAFHLWSRAGASSGMDSATFRKAHEGAELSKVTVGAATSLDAAAGQRYATVPFSYETLARGTHHVVTGSFTLHRTVVEGGDPRWRIEHERLQSR